MRGGSSERLIASLGVELGRALENFVFFFLFAGALVCF